MNIFKAVALILVFSATFVGINFTRTKTFSPNTQKTHVSMLSLGTQSMAYCNKPEEGSTERWDGVCTGQYGTHPDDRCTSSSSQSKDCTMH